MARAAFWDCKEFLRRDMSIDLKIRLLDCYVKSVVSYGCEIWTFNKEIIQRLDALQLWCYRKMLKIKYVDHVTNEKVKKMLGVKQRWSEELAKRELRFAGHIMRGRCGWKELLRGRETGGQRRVWTDDVKNWSGSGSLEYM